MSFYRENIEKLRQVNPEVAQWIDESQNDGRFERISTASGAPNLRARSEQGDKVLFYCMDDPVSAEEKGVEPKDFAKKKVTILLGFGLGYKAWAILNKMEPGHLIIVLEENPFVIKLAFEHLDFSKKIEDKVIHFVIPDESHLNQLSEVFIASWIRQKVSIMMNESSVKISKKSYRTAINHFYKVMQAEVVNANTYFRKGKILTRNELENLPFLIYSSGIQKLRGIFAGIPAIIVSAGPSLKRNVHLLQEAKGRAVIIATGPVLRVLLAYDLRPDFICSVDFSEENYLPLEGLYPTADIPLLFTNRILPKILKDYQGPLIGTLQSCGTIAPWVGPCLNKECMSSGGNVGGFAFNMAAYMGANPIILMGQDLSFTENALHTEGYVGDGGVSVDSHPDLVYVEGLNGKQLPTIPAMVSYLQSFEKEIENSDRTVINATAEGLRIKGTQQMNLQGAIKEYCHSPHDIRKIIESTGGDEKADLQELLKKSELKRGELREQELICKSALKTNRELGKFLHRGLSKGDKFHKLLEKNRRLSGTVQRYCESCPILFNYLAFELYTISSDEYICDPDREEEDAITVGIKRNHLILKANDKAIKDVLKIMGQNIELIKLLYKYRQTLGDSREKSGGNILEISHKVWEKFNRNDESAQGYLRAIKEENGDYFLYCLKAAKSYEELEKFQEAKELLEKAHRHGALKQKEFEIELGKMEGLRKEWLGKAKGREEKGDWINALLYARKIEANYGSTEEIQGIMNWALECRKGRIQQADNKEKEKGEVQKIQDQYNLLLAEAQGKFEEKDYAGAFPLLENAIAFQEIDNSEAESLLACCYSEQGKIEEAMKIFKKLIEKNPDLLFIHKNMGRAYLRNGLFYEGLHTLETLAERDRGYIDLYYEVGNIYFQLGDFEKAAASFEKYLQRYPESYEGHTRRGNCYTAKGWLSFAEKCYQRALSIKPEYDPAMLAIQRVREFKEKADQLRANPFEQGSGLSGLSTATDQKISR